jgi:ABC-type sugar transport system substrate-binding protein
MYLKIKKYGDLMKKLIFLVIYVISFEAIGFAKTYKVALFSPKGSSPFWTLVADFANEAANDLGMEFKLYDAKLSQYKMKSQLESAIKKDKVDAEAFSNFKKVAPSLIKIANDAGVVAFLFNSGLDDKQGKKTGKPRGKNKFWIGEMLPDDEGTAGKIANHLIEAAKSKGKVAKDGKVHVVGISGLIADGSSIVRVNGLKKVVSKKGRPDATLRQVVPTDWSKEQGKSKFYKLLTRYPEATVFWTASYRGADGILEGMKEKGLIPGKDVFVNTLVLNEKALRAVKKGDFTVTAGGHYIEGAWVMILLYDYLNGFDFRNTGTQMRSPMGVITSDNVDLYLNNVTKEKFSKKNLKKIDFTRYSKKYFPENKKYNFDFDSILKQL